MKRRVLCSGQVFIMQLTLIAGISGMNFDYMPELHWRWGYFMVLACMAMIALDDAIVFWRRRWI
ncbi:CorA family divalent cation transporter [Craterilacuibacter sp.]|uniref:CorA family divalent cation transporter n=1 Tax=Craterilacuibacter sp. TaxID=2870909 RepID=UPI003F2AB62E